MEDLLVRVGLLLFIFLASQIKLDSLIYDKKNVKL